ncbi:murein hydrolase activator EnvC family protein [Oceanicella actignis]|uniref:murein hydrolase activator EnvC family protein n=1 Tax=Oceanicella actignis TaxID=1189325 RepID=UPI0011E6756B|nr:peptidoglycan DD-metalloendopeptidase family protein [Oceanicella actignis]TYO88835.1 septal ring factor EnvC (AmiA/AmiB activator) [Oceanicella actignis]
MTRGLRAALAQALAVGLALSPPAARAEDPAHAPAPVAAAPEIEAALAVALIEDAADALENARDEAAALKAAADAAAALESGLAAARARLRALDAAEARLARRTEAQRAQADRLFATLMAMQMTPPPALFAHPLGPVGRDRAAMLMAELTPQLARKAAELRSDVARRRALRARHEETRAAARRTLAALQRARAALAAALREDEGGAPAPSADRLRRAARDLRAFVALLAAPPDAAPPPAPAYGALPPPAPGRVAGRFGQTGPDGARLEGVLLAAPPLTPVLAPFDATLRYAGEMEGYGRVAILEPQPGRLLILAGLAETEGRPGDTLPAGAPVGLTGAATGDQGQFFVEAKGGDGAISTATLYIETREDGAPVDPASWFAFAQ